ncbi:MAG: hypothetical protein DRP50_01375 [Thermotoga sp.]|nr:MAG: hypothetical protein DRP50_01375 [Thermotoga sp.]
MNKMVKFGIVGAGFIGKMHAEGIVQIKNAELVSVYDKDMDSANRLAEKYSIKVARNFEDMLSMIDAVILAIPTFVRLRYIEEAAKAGIHIFSEKPLARTLKDAEEIRKIIEKYDVKFMVGHVVRYFKEFQKMKELIDKGEIGDLCMIRTFRGGSIPQWSSWFRDFESSGGVILDLAIHDMDFWSWAAGPVKKLKAHSISFSRDMKMDHCVVIMEMSNGALAHIEGSWAYPSTHPFIFEVEVVGTRGVLRYSNLGSASLILSNKRGDNQIYSPMNISPYGMEVSDFAECIETGRYPELDYEEGLKALKLALLAVDSAKNDKIYEFGGDMR